jgi:hypothetical protein
MSTRAVPRRSLLQSSADGAPRQRWSTAAVCNSPTLRVWKALSASRRQTPPAAKPAEPQWQADRHVAGILPLRRGAMVRARPLDTEQPETAHLAPTCW